MYNTINKRDIIKFKVQISPENKEFFLEMDTSAELSNYPFT